MYDHILPQLKVALSALKYEHENNTLRYEYNKFDRSFQSEAVERAIKDLEAAVLGIESLSEGVEDIVERMLEGRKL